MPAPEDDCLWLTVGCLIDCVLHISMYLYQAQVQYRQHEAQRLHDHVSECPYLTRLARGVVYQPEGR